MSDIKIPELAESITEGTIAEWLVKKGDKIESGDPVVELETDKINVEVTAEATGVISEIYHEEGEDVSVGDVIAKIDENLADNLQNKEDPPKQAEAKEEIPTPEKAPEDPVKEGVDELDDKVQIIATPAARKRARELNIDLSDVTPLDPFGRIRSEDIVNHAKPINTPKEAIEKQGQPETETQDFTKPVKKIKMTRRRQTIAKNLVNVQHESAMLTTFNEVDMTNIMRIRQQRKEQFMKKHDVKLGFMSFFTKAVIGALKEFPLLNAEIEGNEIIVKKFYDIGIAVSTEDGLVVPIIRDADRQTFAGIEKAIQELGIKARENKLKLSDLQGGTFTITNGGIFGSVMSTPILNSPQVGILGMHNIVKRAVVMSDDSIEVRPMMYLALSYDHRIVDGKEAVSSLVRVKQMLEDPETLLLEG